MLHFCLTDKHHTFVKRTRKETLAENYEEAIVVEKDLHVIGVIVNAEPSKDSKDTSKRSQSSSSKAKDKEAIDLEILSRAIKYLSNELVELK